MSNFVKMQRITKEYLEEIFKNSEGSKFSYNSSQSFDIDMSPENINRPISSESEEDDCTDDEAESDIQHRTCTNAGTC